MGRVKKSKSFMGATCATGGGIRTIPPPTRPPSGPAATPRPWIFLYVALAVGAHLAPSPADMKGGLSGFLLLAFLLLVADAVVLLAGGAPERAAGYLGHVSGMLSALLFIALTLNVGNLGVSFLIAQIAGRRSRTSPRRWTRPRWRDN